MTDPVRQPSHYRSESGIEAIDVIRAWGLDFSLGSALKYLCRAGLKPGQDRRQDIQKLIWYAAEELGGKALANEVAQLVAMELAEGQTQRLPETVEDEPEAPDEAPDLYGVAVAAPALADYQPRVTPEVTPAPAAVPVINSLPTLEEVQPSNHPGAVPSLRTVPEDLEGLLSTKEVAAILGVGPNGVSWHVRQGRLTPATPRGQGTRAFFTQEEVDRFLAEGRGGHRYPPPPDPEQWMSLVDAAAALGTSLSVVRRHVSAGRLRSMISHSGTLTKRWISRESVASFTAPSMKDRARHSVETRRQRVQELLDASPGLITAETARDILGVKTPTGARDAMRDAGILPESGVQGFTLLYLREAVETLAARRADQRAQEEAERSMRREAKAAAKAKEEARAQAKAARPAAKAETPAKLKPAPVAVVEAPMPAPVEVPESATLAQHAEPEEAAQERLPVAEPMCPASGRIPTAPGAQAHRMPVQDDVTRANGYALEAAIRRGREVFALGGVFTLYVRPAQDGPAGVLHYRPAAPRDDAAMRQDGWRSVVRLIRRGTGQWEETAISPTTGRERESSMSGFTHPGSVVGGDRGDSAPNLSNARRIA